MKKIAVLTALLFAALQIGYAQKVGLVLSGGGAKGAAHIGVIKALEENGIPIDYITGNRNGGKRIQILFQTPRPDTGIRTLFHRHDRFVTSES